MTRRNILHNSDIYHLIQKWYPLTSSNLILNSTLPEIGDVHKFSVINFNSIKDFFIKLRLLPFLILEDFHSHYYNLSGKSPNQVKGCFTDWLMVILSCGIVWFTPCAGCALYGSITQNSGIMYKAARKRGRAHKLEAQAGPWHSYSYMPAQSGLFCSCCTVPLGSIQLLHKR